MLKAAILGYGYMGEIRHRVIDSHPDIEVSLICEPDERKLQGNFPFQVVRDIKHALPSNIDVVFVCTPNNLIPEISIEAMKLGKHVFCEKPPGRSLQDVIAIREQEKKSKACKLMFGFNHRYHPGVRRAKALIDSGKFGKVLWIRGVYGKSGGKNFPTSWRNQKDVAGGGILLDQGIHMLDLFNYYCGEFTEVKAFTSNAYWKFEMEDNAFVILRNSSGQNAMLHSSATLWKHRFQIDLGLEKGYMVVHGLLSKSGSYGRETLTVGQKQFEDESDAVGNPSEQVTYFDKDLSWEIEVDKFVKFIKNNEPVKESSSLEALKAMQIVDKAYKNNQTV